MSEKEQTPSLQPEDKSVPKNGTKSPDHKLSMDTSLRSTTIRNTEKEKKFIISQFEQYNDSLNFFRWVQFKSKKDKIKDKLIAIGNYRLFTLKKSTLGKNKIDQDGHFFDLEELTSSSKDTAILKFKNFTLDIFGEDAGNEITKVVREMCKKIMNNFPSDVFPKISIDPPDRIPEEPITFEKDDGYIATYKAACSYHRMLPCSSYIEYVQECYTTSTKELNLNNILDVELKSSVSLNFLPVATSLRYNNFFTKLCLTNIPRKEAISVFASTITTNKCLTHVEFVGTEAEEGFGQFGEALEKNGESKVEYINFSGNRLGDKGIITLSNSFKKLTRGLKSLKISNCGIEPKGISQLMNTLDTNHNVSLTLEELDISYNLIGSQGTNNLASWISNSKEGSKNLSSLKYLNLASTQIDFYISLQAVTSCIVDKLETLDLSENKITDKNVESLVEFLSHSETLQHLILRNTELIPELIEQIFSTINKNDLLDGIRVDLSQNDLGEKGAKAISKTLRYSKHISGLDLHLCNLKKEGITEIVKAIFDNSTIKYLNLSNNLKSAKEDITVTLGDLISNGNLESLDISNNNFGKHIDSIFKALATSKLKVLSIVNNGFSDKVLPTLAESLKKNSHLVELSLVGNSLNLTGVQALQASLQENKTLCLLPQFKTYEIKFMKQTKNSQEREKVGKTFDEIFQLLNRNKEEQK